MHFYTRLYGASNNRKLLNESSPSLSKFQVNEVSTLTLFFKVHDVVDHRINFYPEPLGGEDLMHSYVLSDSNRCYGLALP